MQRPEFEKLLATTLERERRSLREEITARESQKCISFEGFEKDTEGEQHER